ncbi:MAG: glycosyltransferase family 2 protein [Chloroflexaceae bacterium]|nr:glycosyltransferase family 2 protein [Chloroflexaceae bacterium]
MTLNATSALPLVSVIILNFNARTLLPRAVESVRTQEYPAIELILVDNGSTDGSQELLRQYEPTATVLAHSTNLGYAQGMNTGYAAAHGEVVVPLNVDAVLHPTFLRAALARLSQHPEVGVIAAEVVRVSDTGDWRFWQSRLRLPSEGGVVSLTPLLRVQVLDGAPGDWRPSFKANGACPIIRRQLVSDLQARFGVGPFDPVFDTYGEDVDFAFKAWALGWRTMYAREVQAGHVRSYASPLELPNKRGRLRVNLLAERYINAVRHLPAAHALAVVVVALREDVAMVRRQTQRGDREAARDLRLALQRVACLGPGLLRFRRHRTWAQIDFPTAVYCQRGAPPGHNLAPRQAVRHL